jgi:hypothetical protein
MTQPLNYPDTEGFAYSWSRSELAVGNNIYIGIGNISGDQPTEEGVVKGTRPFPLARTPGTMGLGEGSISFTDEAERQRFIDDRGDAYREQTFTMTWTRSAPGRPTLVTTYYGCRLLSEPDDDEEGPDPLGGEVTFSFMSKSKNGKMPHSGMPNPTR